MGGKKTETYKYLDTGIKDLNVKRDAIFKAAACLKGVKC